MTWATDVVVPLGHQMTFKNALHTLSSNLVLKIAVPNWAKNSTKHTRKVDLAFMELKVCYSKSSRPCMPHHHASSRNTCWKWWKLAEIRIK